MRDVAYGTRQYRIQAGDEDGDAGSDTEPMEETLHLERGQNLFEIHVKKVRDAASQRKCLTSII